MHLKSHMVERLFSLVTGVVSVLSLNVNGYADWSFEYLNKKDAVIEVSAPSFQKLKAKMIEENHGTWCSPEKTSLLMELVLLEKPNICVEIGVFTGSSLLPVASVLSYLKKGVVYGIDPWSNVESIKNFKISDSNVDWWGSLDMRSIEQSFRKNLIRWRLNTFVKILKSTSAEACSKVESIDFLHIDGNYSEINSLEDVELYLPKVKTGGYILYTNFGWIVNGELTRKEALQFLLDQCEIVAMIDNRSSFLLRKL